MPGAKVKGGYTLDVAVTTGRTYHLQATTLEDQVPPLSVIIVILIIINNKCYKLIFNSVCR